MPDKQTQVNQGGQVRKFKYDAAGRLLFEKIPEQTPTIPDGQPRISGLQPIHTRRLMH
jgi:hypothetical protein